MKAAGSAAHLVHVSPSFDPGGAQVRTAQIINYFGRQYRHTLISFDGHFGAVQAISPAVSYSTRAFSLNHNPAVMWFHLRRELRTIRPDLLLTYNWGAIDAVAANAVSRICPVIHSEDGFGKEEAEGQKLRRIAFRSIVLRSTYRVVAPSSQLMSIMRRVWRLPPEKLQYIPNGIDVSSFSEVRRERGDGGEIVIGTVGHMRAEKQHDRLVSACAELAKVVPVRLVLAGDGPERPRLEEKAGALGFRDHVTFLGHQRDVRRAYEKMDIFALTSATEQMPLSVLEAMACGLPIVSTDVGDVRNMVSHENTPFVTSESELVGSLRTLAANANARAALGRANRVYCARNYDISEMFAHYAVLYDSALSSTI